MDETKDVPPPRPPDPKDPTQSVFPSLNFLTPEEERKPPLPKKIGPYSILSVLGKGGFGTVFLAKQEEPLRRHVALKVITAGISGAKVTARFELERQTLARMRHPHIAQVYDAGVSEQGEPYYVMEFFPGSPLTKYADGHKLGFDARLEVFLQVCEAVQHAHENGVIHRDLKPGNILVNTVDCKPFAMVIDFGMAKVMDRKVEGQTMVSIVGDIMGTPAYMSPEQASGESVEIGTRSDVYSLGVILYELLAGVLPLAIKDPHEMPFFISQRMILEEEPPRLTSSLRGRPGEIMQIAELRGASSRDLLRRLQGDLEWITLKALQKQPGSRYGSVKELGEDLRRHLDDKPVLARAPSLRYRAIKFARRHRARLTVALAVLLAAAVVSGGTWYRSHHDRRVQFQNLEAAGRNGLEQFLAQRARIAVLQQQVDVEAAKNEAWEPPWEREKETTLRREMDHLRKAMDQDYNEAVSDFQKALQLVSADSADGLRVREALEDAHWPQYQEANTEGSVKLSPAFFRSLMESQGIGKHEQETRGSGRFVISSDPPGAKVYCFRYEEKEERLMPLPFDPAAGKDDPQRGLAGEPFLKVQKVWGLGRKTFAEGDRLVTVNGIKVSLLGDLAQALSKVNESEEVDVQLLRGAEALTLRWTPYPPEKKAEAYLRTLFKPRKVIDVFGQFDLLFEANPLEFTEKSCLGTSPTSAELPPGSYLLFLQLPGHAEARYPLLVTPAACEAIHVRLFAENDVPEGFIHIPGGPFFRGGDPVAYLGVKGETTEVGDFFLSRYEVTFEEYLEFLNDLGTRSTPADGFVPDCSFPTSSSRKPVALVRRDGSKWLIDPNYRKLPVLGITMDAGIEYARWLSKRNGGRRNFRLPGDIEWEKAARGADRRIFVWGNTLYRCFCRCLEATERRGRPEPVGDFPTDDSVYGVRDMAGSASEPTVPLNSTSGDWVVLRGGNFQSTDHRDLRVTTRNRTLRTNQIKTHGLRLAADPPPP